MRFLLSLTIFLLLGGCETITDMVEMDKDNVNPPKPLVEFRKKLDVIELWSENSGSGTDDAQYLNLTPVIANQQLYIADADGSLIAMDATNGKDLWSVKTLKGNSGFWSKGKDNIQITGGLGYGENTIFLGTNDADVIALDASSGEELWRTTVTSEILSAPQRANNIVIVRTIDGKVFALDGKNGERMWIYERATPSLTLRGTSKPVIYNGTVLAGFDAGRLAALELNSGRLMWEARITTARGSNPIALMVDIDSDPLVVSGIVYVASFQGQVAAVQLETGRILWTRNASSYSSISVDDNYLYLSSEDSHVMAFDRYSGNSVWEQDSLHARGVTGPVSIGDYVVVGDFEGYVHWMDKLTGDFVARTRISKEKIITTPVVAGKFIYVYDSDGNLTAYTYR